MKSQEPCMLKCTHPRKGQHLGAEGVYLAGPKSIQSRTPTASRLRALPGVTKAVMRTPGVEHGSHTGGACMMPLDYLRSWYTMGETHFDTKARPQESCSNLLGPLPLCKQCKRTCSLVAFTPVFGLKVASSILARCSFSLQAQPADVFWGHPWQRK